MYMYVYTHSNDILYYCEGRERERNAKKGPGIVSGRVNISDIQADFPSDVEKCAKNT